MIYPSIELKEEYIQRYKNRGSDEKFIKLIDSHWNDFIKDIKKETFPTLIELESGQYLRDAMEDYYRYA